MAGRPYIPFLTEYAAHQGQRRGVKELEFSNHTIVTPLIQFKVPFWGYYLNVPPATVAVVTHPDGQRSFYSQGGMVDLGPGKYGVQFVDMRQR